MAPPTTEPYRVNFFDGDTKVPAWVTTVAAALLAVCLLTILLLVIARRRARKATVFAVQEQSPLSPEEEKEFLSLSGDSLQTAKREAAPAQESSKTAEAAPAENAKTGEAPAEKRKEIDIPL